MTEFYILVINIWRQCLKLSALQRQKFDSILCFISLTQQVCDYFKCKLCTIVRQQKNKTVIYSKYSSVWSESSWDFIVCFRLQSTGDKKMKEYFCNIIETFFSPFFRSEKKGSFMKRLGLLMSLRNLLSEHGPFYHPIVCWKHIVYCRNICYSFL